MKKIVSITAMFMALMISCTKVDVADNNTNPLPMPEKAQVAVQGLGVTPKTNYMVVGEAVQLEVSVSPEEAVAGTVAWTSSDPAIATVDAQGKVTTLGVGIARITAAVEGASATAIVNVFAEPVPATEIKLNKTEITLLAGRATKVKATLLPDGTGEDGVATTDQLNLEWSSSNENVAIVSYGFIQAKGMGEATITAKQGNLSATVKVTVADKIKLQDRSEAWPIVATPKWDKNWSGKITGSHEEVSVSGVDAERFYMAVVAADKFVSIEEVANTIYEQVEERKDAGQDPASLFTTGESKSVNYSDLGDAVAYVLGYDSECEFTGEYSQLAFEAKTPDPVHATGIAFYQGSWNASLITSLELKESKNTILQLQFLPDDCTDTGTITLEAADPSMLSISAYYPSYYSNYYQVTAKSAGTTKLIAKYNDVVSELPVTVTGSSVKFVDCSTDWKLTTAKNDGGYYQYSITLENCSDPYHYILVQEGTETGFDIKTQYASFESNYGDWLQYYVSNTIPETNNLWQEGQLVAIVFGFDSKYNFTGNYAVKFFDTAKIGEETGEGGEGGEGDEPGTGKLANMKTCFFDYDWPSSVATQDNMTFETWILSSGSSGNQSIIGVEGSALLRTESSQWQFVCKNNAGSEVKLTSSYNSDLNKWTHLAVTYAKGGKVKLYVNGELKDSKDIDKAAALNGVGDVWQMPFSFMVGNACDGKRYVQGNLAYARVWKCERTADEIKNNMKKADVTGSDLLASWYFTEGSGNTITDHSGNGRTLTAKKYENNNPGTTNLELAKANIVTTDIEWVDGTLPF